MSCHCKAARTRRLNFGKKLLRSDGFAISVASVLLSDERFPSVDRRHPRRRLLREWEEAIIIHLSTATPPICVPPTDES